MGLYVCTRPRGISMTAWNNMKIRQATISRSHWYITCKSQLFCVCVRQFLIVFWTTTDAESFKAANWKYLWTTTCDRKEEHVTAKQFHYFVPVNYELTVDNISLRFVLFQFGTRCVMMLFRPARCHCLQDGWDLQSTWIVFSLENCNV